MNEIFNSSHKMFIQIYSQKLLGCSVKILGFDPVPGTGVGRGQGSERGVNQGVDRVIGQVGTGVDRGQNLGCFYDHWVCDHLQVQQVHQVQQVQWGKWGQQGTQQGTQWDTKGDVNEVVNQSLKCIILHCYCVTGVTA